MERLEARDVRYEYRTKLQLVRAVNGVSCVFEPGKVYAVVGASGSGKTTFLSLLAGLDVPAGGAITLDGKSTADLDRDAYRLEHVSVIYQNYNLFYHLTVLENAAYPLYVKKIAKKDADAVARRTLLRVGPALLRVTQIGKECHSDCAIRRTAGRCVMPTDGIFAVVVEEGRIKAGDEIALVEESV